MQAHSVPIDVFAFSANGALGWSTASRIPHWIIDENRCNVKFWRRRSEQPLPSRRDLPRLHLDAASEMAKLVTAMPSRGCVSQQR
jgi:hypothetical protein